MLYGHNAARSVVVGVITVAGVVVVSLSLKLYLVLLVFVVVVVVLIMVIVVVRMFSLALPLTLSSVWVLFDPSTKKRPPRAFEAVEYICDTERFISY